MMMSDPQDWQAEGNAGAVDARLARTLAEELVELTVKLSDLAYDLGSEPETLRRHMASLQAVDAITQGQLAIAELLRSEAPITDRIAAVTLDDMRLRLVDRLQRPCDITHPAC